MSDRVPREAAYACVSYCSTSVLAVYFGSHVAIPSDRYEYPNALRNLQYEGRARRHPALLRVLSEFGSTAQVSFEQRQRLWSIYRIRPGGTFAVCGRASHNTQQLNNIWFIPGLSPEPMHACVRRHVDITDSLVSLPCNLTFP